MWNFIEKTAYLILKRGFSLVGKEPSDEFFASLMQFVKFGIVGVSNTVISYVIYVASLSAFRQIGILPKSGYIVSQGIAFVLSVLWSFYWNNKVVFLSGEGERNLWKALAKTYVSYSFTGLFLNSILLVLWVQVFHISEFTAPIINLLISVPLNFILNKLWAFKQ
ncbi:MAG: GtrA family protein [Lachnospiraceae bacterium]|nr:GtrA family protein [Lachnospiraceae bacterium]MDE6981885.1 GtrA family protein [Lachnospiraceae bacterium]